MHSQLQSLAGHVTACLKQAAAAGAAASVAGTPCSCGGLESSSLCCLSPAALVGLAEMGARLQVPINAYPKDHDFIEYAKDQKRKYAEAQKHVRLYVLAVQALGDLLLPAALDTAHTHSTATANSSHSQVNSPYYQKRASLASGRRSLEALQGASDVSSNSCSSSSSSGSSSGSSSSISSDTSIVGSNVGGSSTAEVDRTLQPGAPSAAASCLHNSMQRSRGQSQPWSQRPALSSGTPHLPSPSKPQPLSQYAALPCGDVCRAPRLLSPSQIASLAASFGGLANSCSSSSSSGGSSSGCWWESAPEWDRCGPDSCKRVYETSGRGGPEGRTARRRTHENAGGDPEGWEGGEGHHHVPLFRALAAAAMAPAVHVQHPVPTPPGAAPQPCPLDAGLSSTGGLAGMDKSSSSRSRANPCMRRAPSCYRDASGCTALECMGLGGISKLLCGFTAVAHYDPALWAAAVGDASTWLGVHAPSTLSMLAQAVRRATSGTARGGPSHNPYSLHTPPHTHTPVQPQPALGAQAPSGGPSHTMSSESSKADPPLPPFLLPDLTALATAVVESGHLEAAPGTARPLLTAIAREVAKQALGALPHPATAHNESGRSGSGSDRSISGGNSAHAMYSGGNVGLPSLVPHVLQGRDCSPPCCYVCGSNTAPPAEPLVASSWTHTFGTAGSRNADAQSRQGSSSNSNSGDCLRVREADAATSREPTAVRIAAHSLVQLLSVLSAAGGCGVLLLETAAKLLQPHLHVLRPQALMQLLRVFAPHSLDISSGSTALTPPNAYPLPAHLASHHFGSNTFRSPSPMGISSGSFSSGLAAQRQHLQQQHARTHAQQVTGVSQRQGLITAIMGGPLRTAAATHCLGPWELVEAAGRASAAAMSTPTPPSWPWPFTPSTPGAAPGAVFPAAPNDMLWGPDGLSQGLGTPPVLPTDTFLDSYRLRESHGLSSDALLHLSCHSLLGAAGDMMVQALKQSVRSWEEEEGMGGDQIARVSARDSTAAARLRYTSVEKGGWDERCDEMTARADRVAAGGSNNAGTVAAGSVHISPDTTAAALTTSRGTSAAAAAAAREDGLAMCTPAATDTVAAACELAVAMARVGHHHVHLLSETARALAAMHSPENSGTHSHSTPELAPCSRGQFYDAPISLCSEDASHNSLRSDGAPNIRLRSNDEFKSLRSDDARRALGEVWPSCAPSPSSSGSLLPDLGPATLAHTAAAYARVGAEDAAQLCCMSLQVLGLWPQGGRSSFSSSTPNSSSSNSGSSKGARAVASELLPEQVLAAESFLDRHPNKAPGGFLASLLGMSDEGFLGQGSGRGMGKGEEAAEGGAGPAAGMVDLRLASTLPFHALAELCWATVTVDPASMRQQDHHHQQHHHHHQQHHQQHHHQHQQRQAFVGASQRLYCAAAQAYQQQGTIQVSDPHVLLLAQAHIALTAELGTRFTAGLANTPGLSLWTNTLQYAWQAHTRAMLRRSQQLLVREVCATFPFLALPAEQSAAAAAAVSLLVSTQGHTAPLTAAAGEGVSRHFSLPCPSY
ncbi:hypothetical protein DUNSADRAFT_15976 [Dunaliella salina]|uniref:Uncharacterized protein n=1 Tax=Dunaliella salina TaxID=3046 RepID=A0ABQ7G4H7_DUNSA|nr:hypothetical protein DUNSADRAFT_15976 [Dunaliella salina]|eukprot:KAF5829507.1 hypothetical protein DUNSADRAFT_15976 [Dunaliella salina]